MRVQPCEALQQGRFALQRLLCRVGAKERRAQRDGSR